MFVCCPLPNSDFLTKPTLGGGGGGGTPIGLGAASAYMKNW